MYYASFVQAVTALTQTQVIMIHNYEKSVYVIFFTHREQNYGL